MDYKKQVEETVTKMGISLINMRHLLKGLIKEQQERVWDGLLEAGPQAQPWYDPSWKK